MYLENKRITAQRRKEENLVKRAKEECEKIESELTEIDRRLSGNEACDYTIVSELCSKKDTLEERLMELYEIIMKDLHLTDIYYLTAKFKDDLQNSSEKNVNYIVYCS